MMRNNLCESKTGDWEANQMKDKQTNACHCINKVTVIQRIQHKQAAQHIYKLTKSDAETD